MTDNEWVLVPRTVTAEMEAVYANDTGAYPDAQSLHDAMLAAAPSPPADAGRGELVAQLRERAQVARSEGSATAISDAWYFEESAKEIERLESLTAKAAAPAPGVGDEVIARVFRNSGVPAKIVACQPITPDDWLAFGRACADAAPPAPHGDALTAQERHVIEALLDLAYKAWCLADDSEDIGDSHNVEAADFDALSNALDVLQALPDDQPGYTMGEAAKARWALRRLIGTDAAIAVQAKGGA